MTFKKIALGKRIGIGFALILVVLAAVVLLSIKGIGTIIHSAGEVIGGNQLDGILAQREIDHLNWANKLTALLTDERVTELEVETDDHKCAFGQWLYGLERKDAETNVPSLKPLFKSIEEPHRKLHESAIAIGNNFSQADMNLAGFLSEMKSQHLKWATQINTFFMENSDFLTWRQIINNVNSGNGCMGRSAKK